MANLHITPTHIKALLSTDDQCQWSAWYRARNRRYRKPKNDFDFRKWREQHNDMVHEIVKELEADDYVCTIEDQNSFTLEGLSADVAGKMDVLADPKDEKRAVKVVDAKTGKPYDKDQWQVRIYLAVLPLIFPPLTGRSLVGEVRYLDGDTVTVRCSKADQTRIWDQVKRAAAEEEPRQTPSDRECRYCDILDCPTRGDQEELTGGAKGRF
jgi:CRISPR/Cas system-associated exonuclease Cas4 (RecB family)